MNAINALWSLDARSFHLLNDVLMILLRKMPDPTRLKDFRPMSLMHSFSKIFAKMFGEAFGAETEGHGCHQPECVH
jgi:hypothetical protein